MFKNLILNNEIRKDIDLLLNQNNIGFEFIHSDIPDEILNFLKIKNQFPQFYEIKPQNQKKVEFINLKIKQGFKEFIFNKFKENFIEFFERLGFKTIELEFIFIIYSLLASKEKFKLLLINNFELTDDFFTLCHSISLIFDINLFFYNGKTKELYNNQELKENIITFSYPKYELFILNKIALKAQLPDNYKEYDLILFYKNKNIYKTKYSVNQEKIESFNKINEFIKDMINNFDLDVSKRKINKQLKEFNDLIFLIVSNKNKIIEFKKDYIHLLTFLFKGSCLLNIKNNIDFIKNIIKERLIF